MRCWVVWGGCQVAWEDVWLDGDDVWFVVIRDKGYGIRFVQIELELETSTVSRYAQECGP